MSLINLKQFLGIATVSFFIVLQENLLTLTEDFFLRALIRVPLWIAIFAFFNWREWTK
jgi:hypothetical protein